MMQIYTVYVCKHMVPPTHNPSPPVSAVVVGEIITYMHNIVVPLIDNPTAFYRRLPSWPAKSQCGGKPVKCGPVFVYKLRAKLHLSRCYKCIRAVIRWHTQHMAWTWLGIAQIGDAYSGWVFISLGKLHIFRTTFWGKKTGVVVVFF